jgi:molybdopterin/thiamine biosynthesis adenylyltransferase
MLLKEISYGGQLKIVKSKVALIGSGGIGCPLALYLAAAGVGTLGLFDSDTVDVTNLHRQIGHRTDRLGMEKTESLARTILGINPHISINKHPFITVENAHTLDDYDYVIDGSDNPKCRYIVNDYCMKAGKKLLSGACIGWEAQITCYGGDSLCYRCLWGNDQVSMGGCSSLGVVGMLPGLVGMVLATEALKLIING